MRSPESTVGTNSRLTPNRRKSTDTRSDPERRGLNSPPARKLAGSPETAVRLGSARIETNPSAASASITAEILFTPSENPTPMAAAPVGERVSWPEALEGLTPGDEAEAEVAGLADGIPVDPELLGDAARDLGDANSGD